MSIEIVTALTKTARAGDSMPDIGVDELIAFKHVLTCAPKTRVRGTLVTFSDVKTLLDKGKWATRWLANTVDGKAFLINNQGDQIFEAIEFNSGNLYMLSNVPEDEANPVVAKSKLKHVNHEICVIPELPGRILMKTPFVGTSPFELAKTEPALAKEVAIANKVHRLLSVYLPGDGNRYSVITGVCNKELFEAIEFHRFGGAYKQLTRKFRGNTIKDIGVSHRAGWTAVDIKSFGFDENIGMNGMVLIRYDLANRALKLKPDDMSSIGQILSFEGNVPFDGKLIHYKGHAQVVEAFIDTSADIKIKVYGIGINAKPTVAKKALNPSIKLHYAKGVGGAAVSKTSLDLVMTGVAETIGECLQARVDSLATMSPKEICESYSSIDAKMISMLDGKYNKSMLDVVYLTAAYNNVLSNMNQLATMKLRLDGSHRLPIKALATPEQRAELSAEALEFMASRAGEHTIMDQLPAVINKYGTVIYILPEDMNQVAFKALGSLDLDDYVELIATELGPILKLLSARYPVGVAGILKLDVLNESKLIFKEYNKLKPRSVPIITACAADVIVGADRIKEVEASLRSKLANAPLTWESFQKKQKKGEAYGAQYNIFTPAAFVWLNGNKSPVVAECGGLDASYMIDANLARDPGMEIWDRLNNTTITYKDSLAKIKAFKSEVECGSIAVPRSATLKYVYSAIEKGLVLVEKKSFKGPNVRTYEDGHLKEVQQNFILVEKWRDAMKTRLDETIDIVKERSYPHSENVYQSTIGILAREYQEAMALVEADPTFDRQIYMKKVESTLMANFELDDVNQGAMTKAAIGCELFYACVNKHTIEQPRLKACSAEFLGWTLAGLLLDGKEANYFVDGLSYPLVKIGRKKVVPQPFMEEAELCKTTVTTAKKRGDVVIKIVEKNVLRSFDDAALGITAETETNCDMVRYIFARATKKSETLTDEYKELIRMFMEHSYSKTIEMELDIDDSLGSYLAE